MEQKMQDENGKFVDGTLGVEPIEFLVGETYSHQFRRMKDVVDAKVTKVEELRDQKRYVAADKIAEDFIRTSVRAKKGVFLKRKEFWKATIDSWKYFKVEIFKYDELTRKELDDDESAKEEAPEEEEDVQESLVKGLKGGKKARVEA
jgi:hypothetical protein